MGTLKRLAPFVISIFVVAALGGVGIGVSASANREARDVHREDRETLNETLAGLTDQYIRFSFKEVSDASEGTTWSLRPGNQRDATSLREFIERSALLNHGAALTTLEGQPLNAFAQPPGLPPADEPGLVPMFEALRSGQPGLSSVMIVDEVPLVALGVPVTVRGAPAALLVAFFRADTGPLQVYSERLDHGPQGVGYVVDSQGTVVAATTRSQVGKQLDPNPGLEALLAGKSGFTEFEHGDVRMTATYHPIGLGGWGDMILQPAEAFFGPIDEGGRHVVVALLVLLAVAATALAVLNFFRERALRSAYEYKGQLLANTTHELKTPLTAIRGAALTLGSRWRDMHPESVDQLLGMIHRRTDGLGHLVDRILMGARLDAGRELSVRPEDLEVAGVLRRIATEFADASPRHSFCVTAPSDLVAHVDPEAFDQVVGMLVENAIKYSPHGGRIKLEAVAADGKTLVHVSDEGIGIPEDEQQHIFEPYFRAHRRDDQAYGGVGLGLSICRHLVRLSGGDIEVSSRLGQGTTFSFTAPLAEAGREEPTVTEAVQGWIRVNEAAKVAGVHPSTVRSWSRQGKVRSEVLDVDGRPVTLVAVEDIESRERRARRQDQVGAGR